MAHPPSPPFSIEDVGTVIFVNSFEVESPRGVPQLSRTEVRRVAPFLINPLHWKRVVSRVLAHEHRREFARRRETFTRRTHGGPICQVAFLG